jgi:hypothetical protein
MVDPEIFREHTRRTGEIICQICFESKPRSEMQPTGLDPLFVWDICRTCWEREEKRHLER